MGGTIEGKVKSAIRARYGTFKKARKETGIKSTSRLKAWAAANLLKEKKTKAFQKQKSSFIKRKTTQATEKATEMRKLQNRTRKEVAIAKEKGTTTEKIIASAKARKTYSDLATAKSEREFQQAREERTERFVEDTKGMSAPEVISSVRGTVTPLAQAPKYSDSLVSNTRTYLDSAKKTKEKKAALGSYGSRAGKATVELVASPVRGAMKTSAVTFGHKSSDNTFVDLLKVGQTKAANILGVEDKSAFVDLLKVGQTKTTPKVFSANVQKAIIEKKPSQALFDRDVQTFGVLSVGTLAFLGGGAPAAVAKAAYTLNAISQTATTIKEPTPENVVVLGAIGAGYGLNYALRPKTVSVTRATGKISVLQPTSGKSRVVLETTTKKVAIAKAPKAPSSRSYQLDVKGYGANIAGVTAVGAPARGTGILKFTKGKPSIKGFLADSTSNKINLFSSRDLAKVKVQALGGGTRTVKSTFPVSGYTKTVTSKSTLLSIDSANKVSLYPFISAKDVKVKPSVRSTSKTVTGVPYSIDRFSETSFFSGSGALSKLPKKSSPTPKLSKPVSAIYVIKDDIGVSVVRTGKPYKSTSPTLKTVSPPPSSSSGLLSVTKTTETGAVTKSRPVIKVESVKGGTKVFAIGRTDAETKTGTTPKITSSSVIGASSLSSSSLGLVSVTRSRAKTVTTPVVGFSSKSASRVRPVLDLRAPQKTGVFTPQAPLITTAQTPTTTSFTTPKPATKIKKKSRSLLPLPNINLKSSSLDEKFSSFGVSVKKKGRFQTLAIGLTRQEALFKGSSVVGASASATFKVFETGGFTTRKGGRGLINKTDFTEKSPGLFIEKRGRRIKSTGELKEITYKGIAANRKFKGFSL